MKRAFLSRHRRVASADRYKRRQRLKTKINNTIENELCRFTTTLISPVNKQQNLFTSPYCEALTYATPLGIVHIAYGERIGRSGFAFVYNTDIIHTTFNFSDAYHFGKDDIGSFAIRFTEIVRDVYENTE